MTFQRKSGKGITSQGLDISGLELKGCVQADGDEDVPAKTDLFKTILT